LLITSANPEDRTAQMEQTNLEMELGELDEEVASSIHLLNDWLDVTYNFWSKSHEEIQDFVAKKQARLVALLLKPEHMMPR
jgi:hypothetical protein